MPDYLCVDGPLAGQVVPSVGHLVHGDVVVIEVVDVDQDPEDIPRFEYLVTEEPTEYGARHLRYPGGLPPAQVGAA